MTAREQARFWEHPGLPGVDLLRARYVRHAFSRHVHDGYVICAVTGGVEAVGLAGGAELAGEGGIVLLNPEVPHTAYAGAAGGWSYRVLYPSTDVVSAVAAEIRGPRGTPSFNGPVVSDPAAARMIAAVHDAAEQDNALAAETFLRLAVGRLLAHHGADGARGGGPPGAAPAAARARDLMAARLTDPPSLDELAAETATSPFGLLRAFKAAYGLPPHAWLTGERVRAARRLLDTGVAPADAAISVGFTDQPHLNRHFSRIVGVPPGAYQRERRIARGR
ncbi:AraC-type DNA-binding protein [Actinacidiphila yanglinensis]|uniref:AraC-type DNA-binding protein n=1 Tax=Actinacidiphila yanglinensis TaxID=310779 RepID=A0A1H5WXB5_9ACTN|nr:AraC family transcriptional regulator [Actinacidiphila yanglinensis]SEG04131.1 AraC-type DNA-binding protein [Actinacidiphila yanglinensis]